MSIGKVSGQEMLGISNSNFSGNMGMSLNPSLFVGSPYYSEFNFISGDFFVDNDYAFLKKRNGIFGKAVNGEPVAEESFGDYYNTDPKNAYGSVNLRGPSYIVNKPKHSWGFHTAFRSTISATDVPYHVAKFVKDGLDYTPQQGIFYSSTPFRSASAVWLEFGGTYGRKIHEVRDKGLLTAAVTLKVLAGMDGFYIKVDEFDYVVPSSDVLDIRSFTGEYGHALSTGENDAPVKPLKIRGWGGGADLGLTYYRKPVHGASDCNRSAEKLKKYQYRAGISIIDFGLINFNKETGVYSFSGQNTYWAGLDTLKFDSVHELDSALSSQFYGDPTASQSASSMKMYLPSAISFQFDYCIRASWYVNATLVHAVPLSKESGIVRSSQVAITPRYETREFEAAMPLTFYEYQTPHLGLAFRYRIFVLGTDRLGSFTGLWNTTGFDLFFGIKTNLCDTGGKKKKKPDCPAYSMVN